MAGGRRQRPGSGGTGSGRPARPGGGSGKRDQRRDAASRAAGQRDQPSREPAPSRLGRALNPRKAPTKSRTRLAALVFAGLAVVLGVIGFTVNSGYLRPAFLLLLLALLWGVRALTMR
jgi:hypothetical protein